MNALDDVASDVWLILLMGDGDLHSRADNGRHALLQQQRVAARAVPPVDES
jgi:hypothetical protein